MEKQIYIGIDVSNATLDICVRQGQEQQSFTIDNQAKAIQLFLRGYSNKHLVIAMETQDDIIGCFMKYWLKLNTGFLLFLHFI